MIYVITHKQFEEQGLDRDHFSILHVGNNSNCKSDYLRDDLGDNISHKNSNFCELTGLYWIWKNGEEKQNDITGLVHYRRYFTKEAEDLAYTYFNIKPHILGFSEVESDLSKFDIILPKRVKIFRTVDEFYADLHNGEDLDLTRKAIEKACPEYLISFDSVMKKHYFYYGNMMLCKKSMLDDYTSWLFSIMDFLEEMIDLNQYSEVYQARVFGFISERLLQVWVYHNKFKIKEYPVFNTEEKRITIFEKNINRIKKVSQLILSK